MKPLNKYSSYRRFLEDRFQENKAATKGLTLATYAKAFGMAASTFKMVLTGERNLTIESIHQVAWALKMSAEEHSYFETLVLFEQALGAKSKSYYRRRLETIRKSLVVNTLRVSDRKLLLNGAAINLLIYLIDGVGLRKCRLEDLNFDDIAKSVAMPKERVKSLVESFRKNGLLTIDSEEHVHVVFDKVGKQLGEQEYFIEESGNMIAKARSAFEHEQNFFRAFTLTMVKKDIPSLRADFRTLMDSYIAKSLPDGEEKVVEKVVVGAFPVISL